MFYKKIVGCGRIMFGDVIFGKMNIKMVEIVCGVGVVCKFIGSGGVVIVFCFDGEK